MLKIVFTGPESTGKSTLTELLAARYNINFGREVARHYLSGLNREYTYEDLSDIARLQIEEERNLRKYDHPLLIVDTDLITIKIWSDFKFGKHETWLDQSIKNNLADIYFLCGLDCPWKWDPLREHPDQRHILYKLYHQELTALHANFVELSGSISERMNLIDQTLKGSGTFKSIESLY